MQESDNQKNSVSDKKSFLLGLSVGIAALSLVGFLVMTAAYFSKGGIPQAANQPKKTSGNVNPPSFNNKANSDSSIIIPEKHSVPEEKVGNDWVRGNKDAKVTIVEYSDIQCPFCQRYHETMKQVMAAYPTRVKWIFKHFPLDSIHPYARKAAEATECAGEQGKFWEFLDTLYANQSSLNNDIYSHAAEKLGLDTAKFDACISAGTHKSKVSADLAEGQSKGVRGTPGSFINGQEVKGAQPFESLKSIIDEELAK